MSLFAPSKPKPPPPPPNAPTRADAASQISSGGNYNTNIPQSLVNTSNAGLTAPANTKKRTLIGGS